ncbi:MAG: cysteine--tRNA ligase [Gammaproteobacteria bacterium]
MLQIYNTLTKQKESFKPLAAGQVGLYVCGMTVYDYCHLGHARVLVTFDVITRYMRSIGYKINYIRNITDIDDKIIQRAHENQESVSELTARFIAAMHEDEKKLGILPPSQQPRATDNIPAMLELIQTLLNKKHAYIADNGDVYYAVHQFTSYGCLGHLDIENLRSGARVAVSETKKDPLDFVLWKLAKPGEPTWDSPWGKGRPGWHIECSAMSMTTLGQTFDIHGGGFDLIFPHHENEIAQSEGASGKTFVKTWMHVGFLQMDKEKMSKSLGNFFTIRDVLAKWPAEIVRYFLLSGHYRSPLNYSEAALENAHAALTRFYTALRGLPMKEVPDPHVMNCVPTHYEQRFHHAMDDDFNTPDALAVLFDLAREINRHRDPILGALLRKLGGILGLLNQDPELFLQTTVGVADFAKASALISTEIEKFIQTRFIARQNKNWVESDRIRDELLQQGIILEDTSEGTTWRRV